ncbi:hypothetical protein ACJRO7_022335, partial [Eucalyptus globulus]
QDSSNFVGVRRTGSGSIRSRVTDESQHRMAEGCRTRQGDVASSQWAGSSSRGTTAAGRSWEQRQSRSDVEQSWVSASYKQITS